MHYRKQSATDAVKIHLRRVGIRAQSNVKAFINEATAEPRQKCSDDRSEQCSQSQNSIAGEKNETLAHTITKPTITKLALYFAMQASAEIVPHFHWLTRPLSVPGVADEFEE
jgi:hypothetical protein